MSSKRVTGQLLLLVIMVLGATSCIRVDTSTKQPTMGSELIDLSRAKSLGQLSDEEFRQLRRKVLASF
ncbi:MAG: hypothetical protein ACE37D_12130 [Pseudomonadales bacterium]